MAKDREDRKKEKKDNKERKEKKERKRREAEELAVREKKISKKNKSKSKDPEKKKPKNKSKKLEAVQEKPHKKPKKHKKPSESESEDEPETVTVPSNDSHPIKLPITNESDSDSEFDKEDFKNLLETHTKEELINLIHKTAEKNSRLVSAVLESAELDSSKRNIFVRGLGWDTTHETLKSAFEAYGEIEDCSVVMDKDTGRAKGYGFVMFKTRKGCREALRNPEKRMFNRTVSCNLAAAKPAGAGKPREPVESVKIDLTQSEVVLPGPPPQGMDLGYGLDKGHKQQNVPAMYGGQNMPFYGHGLHPPGGYNPMYAAAFMGNHMGPGGVPNFPMFGPGMMNHGPPNHMGMAGQYGGEGNGGVGPGFDGERAWYLR